VETTAWFKHHAASLPKLSDEDRAFVKDITGCIPLLLRPLLKMKVFDKTEFLKCKVVAQVEKNVTLFYRKLFKKEAAHTQGREK